MKILTSEQMGNIDRRASQQYGIPSVVLMENAALALVEALVDHYPDAGNVAIFCGPGQNGGDGLALARHLENRRITPLVFVLGVRKAYRGDAATNLDICERLGLPMWDVEDSEALDRALARATEADLVVDAIFGTGLNRPPDGLFAEAIRGLMAIRLPILAVDIPSGLSGSSSQTSEPCVRADLTVTFAQPKIPHVFDPAASHCGEIVVADITIPEAAVDAEGVFLSLTTPDEVRILLPARAADSHKGTYGHCAIVAGSAGKSGAAILAARGAIRAGAGLVTVITDRHTAAIVDAATLESMTYHVTVESDSIQAILDFVATKDAAVVGPGLPDEEAAYAAIRELVARIDIPCVLDATAVNAFQGRATEMNRDGKPRLITPHPGELARLLGTTTAAIQSDRVSAVRGASQTTNCVVVLKGHQTVVANPDGIVTVNPTGNPGMASGGMGDVLSGAIAALLAHGLDPFEAARAGVFLHGLAGDLAREAKSDVGLAANDVAEALPLAVEELRRRVP
ncbi:MAG: NAD(P)H-hydrate dehydratase [Acidobacteria bacterium]|nr:NAD(P)H-hydrate dehydratase [Acidobacteriota bacterium]